MAGVVVRVVAGVTLALVASLAGAPAHAELPPLDNVAAGVTTGAPLPGAVLSVDTGTWADPQPEAFSYQWLRSGAPIDGASESSYILQAADVGHAVAVLVTGTKPGHEPDRFTAEGGTIRKLTSTLQLDVRRVHPAPGKNRLTWTAIVDLATERPWPTDGATVTAFKDKDGTLKALGSALVAREAAFVRLPWRQAPRGRTRVTVCFAGTAAVEASCSPYDVVRRRR